MGRDFKDELDKLKKHLHNFCKSYDFSLSEVLSVIGQQSQTSNQKLGSSGTGRNIDEAIPVEIFLIDELGYFESVVKYMKEFRNYSVKDISNLLKRSSGTIWASYYSSKKKIPRMFDESYMHELSGIFLKRLSEVRPGHVSKKDYFRIPVDLISGRKSSPFQSVVVFLRSYFHLRFSEISVLLGKDMHSVWNAANNSAKKLDGAHLPEYDSRGEQHD